MALKNYKPTTPGQRQLVLVDRSAIYKGAPEKSLTSGKISSGGRNNNGRITVRFRGGGHKRALRLVDFKRARHDQPARVERIEYDPNRTGFIALIKYQDGELAYILAPQRLGEGDSVVSGEHVDVKVKSVNTLVRKGKVRNFRGTRGELSDVKKAIVTLEEGHTIDVTTGL